MILYLMFIFLVQNVLSHRTNVCLNFIDYFTLDPSKCWYNPDVYLSASQLIRTRGYPFEEHSVDTEDGYILTMFRIPNYNGKVAFLQHPATTTCTGWIDKGNSSLAFMMWNNGYDVWLGNFRGNFYSRKHISLNPNQYQYWNFSFHEMGIYDIPSQLDYIINTTKSKPQSITFIGYSMSATSAIIYATLKPEHANKWLKILVLMSPAVYMQHTANLLKVFSSANSLVEKLIEKISIAEVIPHNKFFFNLLSICRNAPTILFCIVLHLLIFGNGIEELSPKWFPVIHSQVPGGMSIKCYIHYLQIVNSGRFQFYDYGKVKNLEYYQNEVSPEYPISRINSPIYLMYGGKDTVVHKKDVEILYDKLPKIGKSYGKKYIHYFVHTSFFYGAHVVEKVYRPIIELLNTIYKNNSLII